MSDASVEVIANLVTGMVDIRVAELEDSEGTCLEMSIDPDLAREMALHLSVAAIRIEVAK